MKTTVLQWLACPACLKALEVSDSQAAAEGGEIIHGHLTCCGCRAVFAIVDGVPQLLPNALDSTTTRTAASFGMLWSRTIDDTTREGQHLGKTLAKLSLERPSGLVLDAGCGDGSDTVALAARDGATVVGVDISSGGTQTAFQRTRHLPNAHVVRGDLRRLPFRGGQFGFIYSFGVVHHVPHPDEAVAELARVSSATAEGALYLYEDFAERSAVLRWSLRAANLWRGITTKLPHRVLYALCAIASPVVYVALTVPYKVFVRVPGFRSLAGGMPFHFARGPFDLVGDLYDRFATPVEYRYSRETAMRLVENGGFVAKTIQQDHGWMLAVKRKASFDLASAEPLQSVPATSRAR